MSRTQEIIDQLNAFEADNPDAGLGPNNVWQEVILKLDEFDDSSEVSQSDSSDRFALRDGTVVRYDGQTKRWYEQS